MRSINSTLLVQVLNHPAAVKDFSELHWDLLVRQAKAANLLARIGAVLIDLNLQPPIPPRVMQHFESELCVAQAVTRSALWETARINEALRPLKLKLILLKGAAYAVAGLAAGTERLFQDTDILVPKKNLDDVEKMLMWHGWRDAKQDAYDQKYYREWMHELPPKYHQQRGSSLDVHHNILPETCGICPDAAQLIDAAVKMPDVDYWMLAPADMLLHSASHLFLDGDFANGLRDLSDMDLLWRQFSQQDVAFDQLLITRAEALGLGRPLFYAVRYASIFLKTPFSDALMQQSAQYSPGPVVEKLMDFILLRALLPDHASCADRWTGLARWLLYIRSHWLRMPWYLLLPHLCRKSWLRLFATTPPQ